MNDPNNYYTVEPNENNFLEWKILLFGSCETLIKFLKLLDLKIIYKKYIINNKETSPIFHETDPIKMYKNFK